MMTWRTVAFAAGAALLMVSIGAVWGARAKNTTERVTVRYVPASERVAQDAEDVTRWVLRACIGPAQIDVSWTAPALIQVGGESCEGEVLCASLVRDKTETQAVLRLAL